MRNLGWLGLLLIEAAVIVFVGWLFLVFIITAATPADAASPTPRPTPCVRGANVVPTPPPCKGLPTPHPAVTLPPTDA